MANMSYCRFENTANDLADCLDVIREAEENGEPLDLSESEERAKKRLFRMCKKIAEYAEAEEANSFDSAISPKD